VGVATRLPLGVSAQAVMDGSQPPMTVSGPRTVTSTCSSPHDAVTTVVQPEELVALPSDAPGVADPDWLDPADGRGDGVGAGAGDALDVMVGDGAWSEPCPLVEAGVWRRPQPPITRGTAAIRRADAGLMRMKRSMGAWGSRHGRAGCDPVVARARGRR
jgi:hypothetical protein